MKSSDTHIWINIWAPFFALFYNQDRYDKNASPNSSTNWQSFGEWTLLGRTHISFVAWWHHQFVKHLWHICNMSNFTKARDALLVIDWVKIVHGICRVGKHLSLFWGAKTEHQNNTPRVTVCLFFLFSSLVPQATITTNAFQNVGRTRNSSSFHISCFCFFLRSFSLSLFIKTTITMSYGGYGR